MPGQLANSLQLIAVSNHNKKLTGNPDRTFWRHAHVRSTNFSLDGVKVPLTGNANLGQKTSTVIPREADLLTYLYVCIDLPGLKKFDADSDDAPSYKDYVGYRLIQKIELLIGGNTCLDSLTGDYMYMWQALSGKAGKNISEMVGNFDSDDQRICASQCATRFYVPIPFFFNSACAGGHTGNALPIAAIPFQEIKVRLALDSIKNVIKNYSNAAINQEISVIGKTRANFEGANRKPKDSDCAAFLEAGYVYLDEEEHQALKNAKMEYLITQVQEVKKSIDGHHTEIRLDFNHPVRELVFGAFELKKKTDSEGDIPAAFQNDTIILDPITAIQLRLNSHPRFNQEEGNKVEGRYFRTVQPYQHHSQIPRDADDNFVYSYSFDLDPESPSPSSSLNFSKVDHAVLEIDFDENYEGGEFTMYARNWNVVSIHNGMASLGYAS